HCKDSSKSVPGWEYQFVAAAGHLRTAWAALIDVERTAPATRTDQTIGQVRHVLRRLHAAGNAGRAAPLVMYDAGYSAAGPGGCRTGLVWSGWRGGGQSVAAAASSAMAVRADDSSAMVFPAVQAASSAVVARRLMARGMPRAQEWMTRTASSENRVSLRPAWARWARRYPSASAAVTAGEGMTQRSWTLWSRAAMSPTRRRLLRVGWPMSRT